MQNLLLILLALFASLALLVFVLEKYGVSTDEQTTSKLASWIMPLVGLLLVLSALKYFLGGG